MKENIPTAILCFFEVELRNEDQGGVNPATLGSARDSFIQAPDDVLLDWCGYRRKITHIDAPVIRKTLKNRLDELVDKYGKTFLLSEFLAPNS